jgi:hypothetical protein
LGGEVEEKKESKQKESQESQETRDGWTGQTNGQRKMEEAAAVAAASPQEEGWGLEDWKPSLSVVWLDGCSFGFAAV